MWSGAPEAPHAAQRGLELDCETPRIEKRRSQRALAQRIVSLWRSEFRNLLAGCLRRNALTFEQVCAIQAEGERIVYDGHEVASEDILMAVRDSRCSAYDCEYVALALALESPLVTADKALLRAFPAVAV